MKLSEDQKREATQLASVGCDREAVAKYVGCSAASLDASARGDPAFAAALRRAEAGCELAHMRNVQLAAREARNWRASVWWLERRAPERYARRDADAVGRRELVRFLSGLAAAIADVVRDDGDRRRVLDRIGELAESMSDPLLIPGPEPAASEERTDLERERGE